MESRLKFFMRSVLVAGAYGLVYAMLRTLNLTHISRINWVPMAALRFTCLLYVPIRYWPALIVGEAVPVGYQKYTCIELFGWQWALAGSVPPMLYAVAIMHPIRERLANFAKHASQYMGGLLLCMLLVSLTIGLRDTLIYKLLKQLAPGEQPIPLWLYGVRLTTSNYLTILTVTPIALWVAEGVRQAITQRQFHLDVFAQALQEVPWRVTAGLLGSIVLLAIIGYEFGETMHAVALCGMLAALFAAAWRYGWQSTALVGAAANLGVIALIPTRDDSLTIIAQCIIAAFTTCALLLGARTTVSKRLAQDLERAEKNAITTRELARQEMFTSERHRLAYASMLDNVFGQARQEATRMMHNTLAVLPSSEIVKHYHEFDKLQQSHERLTAGLSPPAWLKLGGHDGPIAQALDGLGVRCDIDLPSPISALARLSTELSIAIYRLSCEVVAYLIKHAPSDHLRIGMAVHEENGKRPVVEVTLESLGQALPSKVEAYTPFLLSLGAFGLSEQGLQRRAQLYDGRLRIERISDLRMRILFRVIDPTTP